MRTAKPTTFGNNVSAAESLEAVVATKDMDKSLIIIQTEIEAPLRLLDCIRNERPVHVGHVAQLSSINRCMHNRVSKDSEAGIA